MNQDTVKDKVALSAKAIEKMKVGDADKSDIGENSGLRVTCGKTGLKSFIYRYRSPINNALKKITLGHYPHMSLAKARAELQRLKELRASGICPATQHKEKKALYKQEQSKALPQEAIFTVKDVIDCYLTEVIEDRTITDQKTGKTKTQKGLS